MYVTTLEGKSKMKYAECDKHHGKRNNSSYLIIMTIYRNNYNYKLDY